MNVIEAAKAAGDDWDSTLPSDKAFLERFAQIIRNQALEDAANVCDRGNNYDNPMTADDCAAAIRAMKKEQL